jgi:hypothetical protein
MALQKFEMNLQPDGRGSQVLVDGIDRSSEVIGLQINCRLGELTTVLLELAGNAIVTGTGEIENINLPDAAVAVGLLDPEEVERRSLQKLDWGDGEGSMVPVLLQTIVEMLDEAESERRKAGG